MCRLPVIAPVNSLGTGGNQQSSGIIASGVEPAAVLIFAIIIFVL